MPHFPIYRGKLPTCLNALNFYHYLLLAYWCFFRPTALKCYFYQAEPHLYQHGTGAYLLQTIHIPAYRQVYFMIPGVVLGITLLINGLMLLILFGLTSISFTWSPWLLGLLSGVLGGMFLALVVGILKSLAFSLIEGVVFIVIVGVAFGVAAGLAFGVVAVMGLGITFALIGGLVFGLAFGIAEGVTMSLVSGVVGSLVMASLFGFLVGLPGGIAWLCGYFRVFLYPFYFLSFSKPAVCWDELAILPLPYGYRYFSRCLYQDEHHGLIELSQVASNPFQWWLIHNVLSYYVHQHHEPLQFLYKLITHSEFDTYVFAPNAPKHWQYLPNQHQFWLSELAGQWEINALKNEQFTRSVTQFLRHRQNTPLTQFARLLYRFSKPEPARPKVILNQQWAQDAYSHIHHYPRGLEINQSFTAFRTFLNYEHLTELAQAQQLTVHLPEKAAAIRPQIIELLRQLGEIGRDIDHYLTLTHVSEQFTCLEHLSDNLHRLQETVNIKLLGPERHIIQDIINHWLFLIVEARTKLK